MEDVKFTLPMLRLYRGITQEELAETVGVTKLTIGRWERENLEGTRVKDIKNLCKALGVTPNDIIHLDD